MSVKQIHLLKLNTFCFPTLNFVKKGWKPYQEGKGLYMRKSMSGSIIFRSTVRGRYCTSVSRPRPPRLNAVIAGHKMQGVATLGLARL